MREEWWESPACFICKYWWAILMVLLLALAAYFTRSVWYPDAPIIPTPTPTASMVPTPTIELPTIAPSPTATRVDILGSGDVQITLSWNSTNDLDLWVRDPDGFDIYYGARASVSGGQLDVDANPGCQYLTTQPVENIFWPIGGAPQGQYEVSVQYYQQCETDTPIEYTIRVLVDGKVSEFHNTIEAEHLVQLVTTFER